MKYKVIGCSNPAGQTGVDYACCRAVSNEILEPIDIFKSMEYATTYHRADIVGVCACLKEFIHEALVDGQHVDLKTGPVQLGILSPSLKSRCFRQTAIQAQGFNPQGYITGVRPKMRLSTTIQNEVKLRAKLERVPSTLMQ